LPVFGFALSLIALRLLSVILGSYGIFFLVLSFWQPNLGGHAFVLLGTAAAIVYFGLSEPKR
jgi:hypothetical protein